MSYSLPLSFAAMPEGPSLATTASEKGRCQPSPWTPPQAEIKVAPQAVWQP
jgi:hypothetical protein